MNAIIIVVLICIFIVPILRWIGLKNFCFIKKFTMSVQNFEYKLVQSIYIFKKVLFKNSKSKIYAK